MITDNTTPITVEIAGQTHTLPITHLIQATANFRRQRNRSHRNRHNEDMRNAIHGVNLGLGRHEIREGKEVVTLCGRHARVEDVPFAEEEANQFTCRSVRDSADVAQVSCAKCMAIVGTN
jgi:hypothetical protein